MKKVILFLITALGVLLFVKLFYSYPTILTSLQFDAQNLIVWKYAAKTGLLPYRDVFYPYGILNYYLNVSPHFTFLYSLLFLALFSGLVFGLYRALDKTYYAFLVFVLILYNILFLTGVVSFSRYGVTIVTSLVFATMLFKQSSSRFVFLFGLISGLSVGLVTDQGIALITVLTSVFVLHTLLHIKKNKKKKWILSQFKSYLLYALGCLIGVLPFLIYFIQLRILDDFVLQFLKASDISLFAKTPYFHALREINEAGNFLVLYVSIAYLTYILLFKRKTIGQRFYVLFALCVSLFLFEQKSIIRFVGHQIDFVSLTLLLILIYDVFHKRLKNVSKLFFVFTVVFLLSLIIFVFTHPISEFTDSKPLIVTKPTGIMEYQKVIDKLLESEDYKGKIFSLPGDPIFYVANKQSPPYYFTNYEASPRYAQESLITYMKGNSVEYVIFNTSIQSIQDGVPDYVRSPYLYSYVFKNYSPVFRVNNFVVLKKSRGVFENNEKSMNDISTYFLTSNLGNIPRSEGKNKTKYILPPPEMTITSNSQKIQMSSYSKVLLVYYKKNITRDTDIKIVSGNDEATIKFHSCGLEFPCLINISNIPLFYYPKIIETIDFDTSVIKKVELYTQKQRDMLW